jgi:CheY-like chemotaxis protein
MPCVLIVEDDPDIREFMELLLADAGYDTMTAENGSLALERMRARRPCLVLLDLAMPVMDGWATTGRSGARPGTGDLHHRCLRSGERQRASQGTVPAQTGVVFGGSR